MNKMDIFNELIKYEPGLLEKPIEELVPISFIGGAAIQAYRAIVSKLSNLPITQEQKEKTLRDGQDAGKMLLAIEGRIGELLPTPEEARRIGGAAGGKHAHGLKSEASARPGGLNEHQAETARIITKHPEIVKEVIKEAEDNEDIPTKTTVLTKVKQKKEKKQREAFEKARPKIEEKPYLSEYLESCIDRQIQTNTVLKEIFDNPDQIEADRIKEFTRHVKRTVEIIQEKTGRMKQWKMLQ